jgi:hypothetical protein
VNEPPPRHAFRVVPLERIPGALGVRSSAVDQPTPAAAKVPGARPRALAIFRLVRLLHHPGLPLVTLLMSSSRTDDEPAGVENMAATFPVSDPPVPTAIGSVWDGHTVAVESNRDPDDVSSVFHRGHFFR